MFRLQMFHGEGLVFIVTNSQKEILQTRRRRRCQLREVLCPRSTHFCTSTSVSDTAAHQLLSFYWWFTNW